MGHRLTIAMTRWQATVNWDGAEPVTAELVVETDSFEVLRGEGGVKGLSGPEKAVVRSNALKSLERQSLSRDPLHRRTPSTRPTSGYRLTGTLQIRGKSREHVIDLRTEDLGDSWQMSAESSGSPIGLRHQAVLATDGLGAGRRRGDGVFHRGSRQGRLSPTRRRRRGCARVDRRRGYVARARAVRYGCRPFGRSRPAGTLRPPARRLRPVRRRAPVSGARCRAAARRPAHGFDDCGVA